MNNMAGSEDIGALIERHLDRDYLVNTLSSLAKVPTDIEMGFQTRMAPDHPKLVHYIQDVMRPELSRLGTYNIIEVPTNQIVGVIGDGTGSKSILIQNYPAVHHHNLMEDPFSGRIKNAAAYGYDEPAVFGRGASGSKVHQATMLAVLKLIKDSGRQLRGRLYWCVNAEGRSSHACSNEVLRHLPTKPDFAIQQAATGMKISLGNRGRVDVDVHIKGKMTHSSTPAEGHSAIEAAATVVDRVRRLGWNDTHPLLGGRHAIVYKMAFEPMAPHTLPGDGYLTVDRRLLPGDDVAAATKEVADVIGNIESYDVTAETGTYMHPALVDRKDPWVEKLASAHQTALGKQPVYFYNHGATDAGAFSVAGIPVVRYGGGGPGAVYPAGIDFVTISQAVAEARVLASFIFQNLA